MSVLLVEFPHDGVALLRINRPQARNALNMEVRRALLDRLAEFAIDDNIRCVILTGDRKAFAAGADISEMVDLGPIELMQRRTGEFWDAIASFPKALIAGVNGVAFGGGCELAMHADLIIAGESAKFGQPEVKIGIVPGGGATQRLTRAVGKFKAMKIMLTGEPITAAEACSMGLVSEVVPDIDLEARTVSLAAHIASLPPIAVRVIKEVVLAGQDSPLATGLALERKALQVLFATRDKREGIAAFIEKRKPHFEGK